MITRTVNVIKKETKDGAKGPYMAYTLSDGSKERAYPVFNAEWKALIETALENKKPLDIDLEKEGNFWNLKGVRISEGKVEEPKSSPKKSYGKSQDEEDWTNIRTAVMQAVAARPAQDKPNIKGIMNDANEMFADMCVMKPNRSKDA